MSLKQNSLSVLNLLFSEVHICISLSTGFMRLIDQPRVPEWLSVCVWVCSQFQACSPDIQVCVISSFDSVFTVVHFVLLFLLILGMVGDWCHSSVVSKFMYFRKEYNVLSLSLTPCSYVEHFICFIGFCAQCWLSVLFRCIGGCTLHVVFYSLYIVCCMYFTFNWLGFFECFFSRAYLVGKGKGS